MPQNIVQRLRAFGLNINFQWRTRRVVGIFFALGLGWAVTGVIIYGAIVWASWKAEDLYIGILSAWIGELIFFTLIGALVSIITLRDPSKEVYDDRVRILFGDGPDSVINYNKRIVAQLSAYTQRGERNVVIEEYSARWNAYRCRVRTAYHYRNLLHDVGYEDTLPWQIEPDPMGDDAPAELGRVLSIRLGGVETIQQPHVIPAGGFTTELRLIIDPDATCDVSFEYWIWLKTDEIQYLEPRRVAETFRMTITNQTDVVPLLEIDGVKRDVVSLLYNQPVAFDPVQGVSPGERIFVYKLRAPATAPATP